MPLRPRPRPYVIPVKKPEEPVTKEEQEAAQASADAWLDALGGVVKRVPIMDGDGVVIDHRLMPVIGGRIIELETTELQDYEIIGGFGDAYKLVQRQGSTFGVSDQVLFLQDQTAFKGVARYDGKPVFADSFVIINFNNTSPTTTATFADDYANTDLGTLTVTAAAGGTAGKTVLTVTGTEASGTTLKYKIGDIALTEGQKLGNGWTDLTSGTTAITAAAGTVITVAELNGSSRVIKRGQALSVPKTT